MRYFTKTMKNIRSCQPGNKPESTKFDQHVEIPKNVSAMGFQIDTNASAMYNPRRKDKWDMILRRLRRNTDCGNRVEINK